MTNTIIRYYRLYATEIRSIMALKQSELGLARNGLKATLHERF